MSHLKQENDSPLQLNTEECTFHFSFYIFLGPQNFGDSKFPLLYVLRVEYISCSLKQRVAGKKFYPTFYEFKVYILSLKVLLYFLIIFWKIRIDTLYEGSMKLPPGNPNPKNSHPSNSPWNITPQKIATQNILTWNIPTHFIVFLHLTLRFDKFSQHVKTSAL